MKNTFTQLPQKSLEMEDGSENIKSEVKLKEHVPFIIKTDFTSCAHLSIEEEQIPLAATLSFHTTDALCNHIQHLIYDHLSKQYDVTCANKSKYVDVDQNITRLKKILLNKTKDKCKPVMKDIGLTPTQTTRNSSYDLSHSVTLRDDPMYSINSSKCCNCKGSLRQDWNTVELEDEERNWKELKPCWFELFFDLMFVASIVHISSETVYLYDHGHGSFLFILQVFAQFGIFVICWMEQVLYQSRFRMNQPIDGVLRFIYIALVLMMGLGISDNESFHRSFLISYIASKITMSIMLVKASYIPRAFNHAWFMISEKVITITATIFILVSVNMDSNSASSIALVYLIIFSSLFIYSYFHIIIVVYCDCIRRLGINIPINVPHVSERMGAFVLIILGETIISIVVQHFEADFDSMLNAYLLTFAFFVIVYCAGKLYFESQPTEHEIYEQAQSHALTTSIGSSRIYVGNHFILFFALLGLGIGSKLTTHNASAYNDHVESQSVEVVFLPGISSIITLISINIIRLTHPFDYSSFNKILVISVWVVRIITIVFMFGILFAYDKMYMDQFDILIIYVICFIIQIIIDFESRHRMKEDIKHLPKHSTSLKHSVSLKHSASSHGFM